MEPRFQKNQDDSSGTDTSPLTPIHQMNINNGNFNDFVVTLK